MHNVSSFIALLLWQQAIDAHTCCAALQQVEITVG